MLCIVVVGDADGAERPEASLHAAPSPKKRRRHAETHQTSRELLARAQVPGMPGCCHVHASVRLCHCPALCSRSRVACLICTCKAQ